MRPKVTAGSLLSADQKHPRVSIYFLCVFDNGTRGKVAINAGGFPAKLRDLTADAVNRPRVIAK